MIMILLAAAAVIVALIVLFVEAIGFFYGSEKSDGPQKNKFENTNKK